MRDPEATIEFERTRVVRHTREALAPDHVLRSALADRLATSARMVPFELLDDRAVSAERVQFVSYPFEWCDAQLFEAAQLTLQLQQEAVAASFDLKDASAWNIVFNGLRPVFCDLMSFQRLDTLRW